MFETDFSINFVSVSGLIIGTSPFKIKTLPFFPFKYFSACNTAWPVPNNSSWYAYLTSSPSTFSTCSLKNPTTAIISSAPAFFANSTTLLTNSLS